MGGGVPRDPQKWLSNVCNCARPLKLLSNGSCYFHGMMFQIVKLTLSPSSVYLHSTSVPWRIRLKMASTPTDSRWKVKTLEFPCQVQVTCSVLGSTSLMSVVTRSGISLALLIPGKSSRSHSSWKIILVSVHHTPDSATVSYFKLRPSTVTQLRSYKKNIRLKAFCNQ